MDAWLNNLRGLVNRKPLYPNDFQAFSAADAHALTTLVQLVARPGMRICEVGSWLGTGSTQALLQAIAPVPNARLLCVDTWRGNKDVARHTAIARDYDVLGTFLCRTRRHADRLDVLISESVSAADLVANHTFDLVFLDADHSYSAVSADIAAWRSKVRADGLFCGHDCEARLTNDLAAVVAAHCEQDAVMLPGTRFGLIHAGCVRAVHEAFGGRADLLAESTDSTIWVAPRAL